EKRYADLSEQLYQENATRQIAEMQAEYDLDKVERENLELREKTKVTEAKNAVQRNFFIILSFFGAGLVLLLYFRFRDKSLANKVLESQKGQIERQNKDLAQLNAVTQAQNEEIARAKNSIEAQNKTLEAKNEEIQRKQNELQKTYQDLNYSHSQLKETNINLAATAAALDESNQKLNQSYGKITSSITYAKRIQDAMLPNPEAFENAFSEFFIFYRPKDIVSGDFYWFAEVGDKVVVVAADCTGHGVPGAIMSMAGNAYLNQIVLSQRVTDPAEILKKLHSNISKALRQKQTDNKDGMDASICVFDRIQKVVRFAGAKNPVVYIQNEACYHLKGDRAMIGGTQDKVSHNFTTHEIKVDCPTKFYIYSDGYQDQFGGAKNTKFLSKRFRNLLFSTSSMPMNAQRERIETTFDEWRGENRQLDDVLVLGLTIEP
ncbi:MAG: SpoIIE family protein phosphatase, partial [Bacteroidota bacterium]